MSDMFVKTVCIQDFCLSVPPKYFSVKLLIKIRIKQRKDRISQSCVCQIYITGSIASSVIQCSERGSNGPRIRVLWLHSLNEILIKCHSGKLVSIWWMNHDWLFLHPLYTLVYQLVKAILPIYRTSIYTYRSYNKKNTLRSRMARPIELSSFFRRLFRCDTLLHELHYPREVRNQGLWFQLFYFSISEVFWH